ncbi:MAG: nucleotidyltransferase family protein [Ruminococcaceae bacterium]|nr:nucleotidyltransferase family protein [Oscillospiraceae bacterium]
MKIAGIIAEYNPFHAGHAWQIAALREMGYDAVVCVCSPSIVQRGTQALMPIEIRTRAALFGGADLVLCLPAPYADMSAEGFAAAGVKILASLGTCDTLAFGAEDKLSDIERVVDVLLSDALADRLQRELSFGKPFAAARAAASESLLAGSAEILQKPNNILAAEYCKALRRLDIKNAPAPLALPRNGAEHDAKLTLSDESGFASASALRAIFAQNGAAMLADYVPAKCLDIYIEAEKNGLVLDENRLETAILSRLRAMNADDFAKIRGVNEGLENRLAAAAKTATTLEEMYSALKSKRYAHSRMRRLVLDCVLGFTPDLPKLPPYIHVLGATQKGREVLSLAKDSATLPISASLAQLAQTSKEAKAVAEAHAAAEDLAALCLKHPKQCGTAYTNGVIMV